MLDSCCWPRTLVCFLLALAAVACGHADHSLLLSEELTALGVDLDALFAEPTDAELNAVRADWATRDLSPEDVNVVWSTDVSGGVLQVLSHRVDGHLHYGAVWIPDGPGPFPLVNFWLGFGPPFELDTEWVRQDASESVIIALPAFRGTILSSGEQSWLSDGPRFDQCDGGGDDGLAFMNVVLSEVPSVDVERIAVVGGSRGANVGLLAGARDERVRAIAALYGPTRYLDREWLDHPNLQALYRGWFVEPLLAGVGTVADARHEMLACSPVFFVEDLPPVQLHHGEADAAVPVSAAYAFADAWAASSQSPEDLEAFYYPDENHGLMGVLDVVNEHMEAFLLSRLDVALGD